MWPCSTRPSFPPSCFTPLPLTLVLPSHHPNTWQERQYESNLMGGDPDENKPSLLHTGHFESTNTHIYVYISLEGNLIDWFLSSNCKCMAIIILTGRCILCLYHASVIFSRSCWDSTATHPPLMKRAVWGALPVKLFMRHYTDWLAILLPSSCLLRETIAAELQTGSNATQNWFRTRHWISVFVPSDALRHATALNGLFKSSKCYCIALRHLWNSVKYQYYPVSWFFST